MITATPAATPTATPRSMGLLDAARRDRANGDYQSAIVGFRGLAAVPGLSDEEQRASLLGVAEAQLRMGTFAESEATLTEFLHRYPDAPETATATFWLAQARQGQMDWEGAIVAFRAYLELDDVLTIYVSEMLADSLLELGDHPAALAAYQAALTGGATVDRMIAIRERLAQANMSAGEFDDAVAQYDAIRILADDDDTLARMDYLAGYALIMAGLPDQGYARYLHAVNSYPDVHESYLALIELVEAGHPVDEFQRGLVDYNVGATIPAIGAFHRYIEANPNDHRADVHLYLARCYLSLGNYAAALAELELLLETHQGDPQWDDGWLEKAETQAEWGDVAAGIETYLAYANGYPESELAPAAAAEAAALREEQADWTGARQLYQQLAASFPDHEGAPEGLFRAGIMAFRAALATPAGAPEVGDWETLVDRYPASDWYAPALIWLMRTLPAEEAATYASLAAALPPDSYYAIRAVDRAAGLAPFHKSVSVLWPEDDVLAQTQAERWLRAWLAMDQEVDVAALSPAINSDPRWLRGQNLWDLGLLQEARTELEDLRHELSEEPLAAYQLALAFRDMGLYGPSILAAIDLISLSPAATPLEAPPFIIRLAYPAHYRELVESAAAEYGLDPLLLLSMIWQESLFESFVRSWAGAQGLTQVIPSTGEYIAQQMDWPAYRNDDLFKPFVSISFGAYYLAEQMQRFGGDPFAALSAYNAGPGNAAVWFDLAPGDPDAFLEIVTLNEPRRYLQGVYTRYAIYRAAYGRQG